MKDVLKIIPWITILILVVLLLRACHKEDVKPPKVESVKSQTAKVVTIIQVDQQAIDSIERIAAKEAKAADFWEQSTKAIQKDYAALAVKIQSQAAVDCPNLTQELERLAAAKAKETEANGMVIASLKKQIVLKSNVVKTKDGTIKKLLSRIDTCLLNQTALQKYADKVRHRTQLYVGVEAVGNTTKIINGYGITAGLRFKNSTMLMVKVLQVGGQLNYGAGIMMPVSFRRK
jgi:transketolase